MSQTTIIDPALSAETLAIAKALYQKGIEDISNNLMPPATSYNETKAMRDVMTEEDNNKLDVFVDEVTAEYHSKVMNSSECSKSLRIAAELFVEDTYMRLLGTGGVDTDERRKAIAELNEADTLVMFQFVHSDVVDAVIRNKLRSNGYDPIAVFEMAVARDGQGTSDHTKH